MTINLTWYHKWHVYTRQDDRKQWVLTDTCRDEEDAKWISSHYRLDKKVDVMIFKVDVMYWPGLETD